MAASPTAYLFYGLLLDDPACADLEDDDSYAAIEEALGALGVEVVHYGETPNARTALAIDRSVIRAHSGSASRVSALKVGRDWDERLTRARELVELPEQEPAWYVTSHVSW